MAKPKWSAQVIPQTLVLPTFAAPMELRTPRLLLRQWKESDFDAWAEMNADTQVRKYFPRALNRDEARGEFDRISGGIQQRGWGMWAVEVPGVVPFIGFVGLNPPMFPAPWQPNVEIGWRLARIAWGKGYATEGAEASLFFAFEHLRLASVLALSVTTNAPSHAVMERIGMQRWHGMEFDHPRVPSDWPLRNHLVHRIDASDWHALRAKRIGNEQTQASTSVSKAKRLKTPAR
jgi:RimJ/RimL family protein N-acetyltransferase